jgi:hypothetical protein
MSALRSPSAVMGTISGNTPGFSHSGTANSGQGGSVTSGATGHSASSMEQIFSQMFGPGGSAYGPRPPFMPYAGMPRPQANGNGGQASTPGQAAGATNTPHSPQGPVAGSNGAAPATGATQQPPLKADIDKLVTDKKLDAASADVLRGLARARPEWAKQYIAQTTSDASFNKGLLGAVVVEANDTPAFGQPSAILQLPSSGHPDGALAQKGAVKMFETNPILLRDALRSTRPLPADIGWPRLINSLKPYAPAASATPNTPTTPTTPVGSTPGTSSGAGGQPITINFSPIFNINGFTPSGQAVSSTVTANGTAPTSPASATTAPVTSGTTQPVKPATAPAASTAPAAGNATQAAPVTGTPTAAVPNSQAQAALKPPVVKPITQAEFAQLVASLGQAPAVRPPMAFSGLVSKP